MQEAKTKKGRRVNSPLLVRFDSGRSLREGVGSALELAAYLARESTPARNVKFRHIFNGLGKGISRALDLRGTRDSTLHLPARLSRQLTPITDVGRDSGSVDNGGGHHGNKSSEGELHFAGLFEDKKDDDSKKELVLWISESSDEYWESSWLLLIFSRQEPWAFILQ